jgi:hypothetical protein
MLPLAVETICPITGLVKVLFVSVSVVALPTNVSVDVGNVNVPVLEIDAIIGVVKVLLVSVCVPVKVATVLSMAMVPVDVMVPPVNPVPAVIDVTVPTVGVLKLNTPEPLVVNTCPFEPSACG